MNKGFAAGDERVGGDDEQIRQAAVDNARDGQAGQLKRYRSQLTAADRVEITRSDLAVESWSRVSRRQEPMAGLVGSVELAGDLKPFLPLFALAQLTHVGKGATLGLGRVQVTA